jgi:glycosyltransferase involved in cell wall biosynthesis
MLSDSDIRLSMAEFSEECVTIVIPTKDREEKLHNTLESLEYNCPKAQIIVVNDGSPFKNISKFAKFQKVSFIENELQPGEAGAVNTAWQKIKTELVTIISDDDPQGPNWIPELLKAVNDNPTFGVFYPSTIIKEHGKADKVITAKPFNLRTFHKFLKCPCLAGSLLNFRLLRPQVPHLRVPGQTYPNDLVQWLNLSLICDFKAVPKSRANWYVHSEQFSQKMSSMDLSKAYMLNVGTWYLKEAGRTEMTPMIIYLRSLQLAVARRFSILEARDVTLDFFNFFKELEISFVKWVYQFGSLIVQLFWLKLFK